MKSRIIHTPDYCANRIELCKLKFERAMDRFDIHEANIACAQQEWWERELERVTKQQELV